jgi:hypothetical protein
VSGFVKFDPWAFLEKERQAPAGNGTKTLAGLATLASLPSCKNNPDAGPHVSIREKKYEGTFAKVAKLAKVSTGDFPFAAALTELERGCPVFVKPDRWQRCREDGRRFLTAWGEQAAALGWTADDLFGLAPIPDRPKPSFERLSRYDLTGLIWLLDGRRVIAMSDRTAAIETPSGGTLTYRRHNKPALGPLGDSLDDFVG